MEVSSKRKAQGMIHYFNIVGIRAGPAFTPSTTARAYVIVTVRMVGEEREKGGVCVCVLHCLLHDYVWYSL